MTVSTPLIQKSFFRFGILSLFSLISFIRTGSDASGNARNYDVAYLVQASLIFILLIFETLDIFIAQLFHIAVYISKNVIQALLLFVSFYTFFFSWKEDNASNGRIWAQIYFYISVMDFLKLSYEFIAKIRNGRKISFGFAKNYVKKAYKFKQERDVEMTDDIYCVSYLSHIFLYEKQLIERDLLEEPDFE